MYKITQKNVLFPESKMHTNISISLCRNNFPRVLKSVIVKATTSIIFSLYKGIPIVEAILVMLMKIFKKYGETPTIGVSNRYIFDNGTYR